MAASCRTLARLTKHCSTICRNHRILAPSINILARSYCENVSAGTESNGKIQKDVAKGINERVTIPADAEETSDMQLEEGTVDQYDSVQDIQAEMEQDESLYEDEPDVLYSKLLIEVKGHDPSVLDSYHYFVAFASKQLGLTHLRVYKPKRHVDRISLLKSVHIFKKHQTQYEQITHFRIFSFEKVTGSTADTFLEYIQRNLPEGVSMKVTKHRLETLPSHLKPPASSQKQDVQQQEAAST